MAEELDLNKLRQQRKLQREKPAEETREQKIAKLEARIVELESAAGEPSTRERFTSKGREEQEAELLEYNQRQELESEKYASTEEYASDLSDDNSLNALRLSAARLNLEKLRSEG